MKINWDEHLQPEEKLLWESEPDTFKMLDQTYQSSSILKTLICAIIGIGLCVGYVVAAGAGNVKPLVIVIILLICGAVPFGEFSDARNLRKAAYAATDKRLIVLASSAKGVEYEKIQEAVIRRDAAGHMTLLGSPDAVKSKPSKWRLYTVSGPILNSDNDQICDRFAMYAVKDLSGLEKVLRDKLPGFKG